MNTVGLILFGEKTAYLWNMTLNSREIAFLIWFLLAISGSIYMTWGKSVLPNLVKAFFQKQILTVLALMLAYILASIWLISKFGCWYWSNIKVTVIWAISFAFLATFNFQKIETEKAYFSRTLRQTISVAAMVAFVTGAHTFNLPVELILSGALIFLALVSAVGERDKKYKTVHFFVTALLVTIALLMLCKSIYHIVIGFREFATLHNAREFLIPILLTVLFLPFLYAIHAYGVCERVLVMFRHQSKDGELTRYAAFRLMRVLGFDLAGWEQWRQHAGLFSPKSRSDVDAAINEVKKSRMRQRQPYQAQPESGWIPDQAVKFLAPHGLATNHYHRTHVGWWASSRYLDIGESLMPNNVVYYIKGDEFIASELKLVLNVNDCDSADEAYQCFFDIVSVLMNQALPGAPCSGREVLPRAGDPILILQGHAIKLERIDWPKHARGGHQLVFTIAIIATDPGPEGQAHGYP